MAESQIGLTITTNGASEASSALGGVSQGMQGISQSHMDLKGKFQERFQHIGLMLFAGDALRAAGLGRETRMVINTMNIALNSTAMAGGLASGGIMLVVTALVALSGILATVLKHHKNLFDQLEKTNKSHHEELKATIEIVDSIKEYEKETGKMPGYLKAWEDSEKNLMKIQIQRQIEGDKAQISALILLMNEEERHREKLKEAISDNEIIIAQVKKAAGMTDVYQGMLVTQNKGLKDVNSTITEHKAKLDQLIASVRLLRSEGTDDIKKLTVRLLRSEGTDDIKKLTEEHKKAREEADRLAKKHDELYKHVKEASDKIIKEFGMANAKMIVEGKSFGEEMGNVFKNMAEMFIELVTEMMVKWVAFQALTGGFGFSEIGVGSFLGVLPQASGGNYLVERPTMFLAGEAGPEMATFTPLAAASKSGNSMSVSIGNVHTEVYGVQDADRIANEVGLKIVQRIRGMGDIAFARPF
jgi:hypothetical protein